MPLTKDFKETVRARLLRSAGFRKAVFQEAIDGLLAGDVDTGKALLRDYINGTMSFERLGELTHIPEKRPDADARAERQRSGEKLVRRHRSPSAV